MNLQALSPAASQHQQHQRPHSIDTGPAGLLIGKGVGGPVTLRLFGRQPTRIYLAIPSYLTWLLAFRAMCIGAHLSVIAADHRDWLSLADTVRRCGGTIDLLSEAENLPGRGRLYRPSLIIDEVGAFAINSRLGAWQSLAVVGNPASSKAIGELRACDLALLSPLDQKGAEHLRRAYALVGGEVRAVSELEESEVIVAGVRRIMKVKAPPSPTEYRLLFDA